MVFDLALLPKAEIVVKTTQWTVQLKCFIYVLLEANTIIKKLTTISSLYPAFCFLWRCFSQRYYLKVIAYRAVQAATVNF